MEGATQPHKQHPTPEEALGKVVAKARLERGYSQERLAFESGLHRTYISLLERGLRSPKFGTLVQLAKALAVKPSVLVAEAEEEMLTK